MPADMRRLLHDLRAETDALLAVLEPLDESDWDRPTPAAGWNVRDQVTHLAFFDEAAIVSVRDPLRFRQERDEARAASDDALVDAVAAANRDRSGPDVLAWFRAARGQLVRAFGAVDAAARVPWYGSDMSAAASLTARIMETWAHGRDVTDALGVQQVTTSALRQVAHIGVRALPNSFVTRGLPVPDAPVRVELRAPGGSVWTWGPDDAADEVRGDALDFCLVVTQRLHRDDAHLEVSGPVADAWMSIAQAYAGPPGEGRPPSG